MCIKHGAKTKQCSSEGCTNLAQRGGVCVRHGAKTKRCSSEGCTSKAWKGGVCAKHGAKSKLCSSEGCTNKALRRGVCWRHGGKRTPHDESTAFGSELEKTTTATDLPHPSTVDAIDERSRSNAGVPGEVVICQEIVEVEV